MKKQSVTKKKQKNMSKMGANFKKATKRRQKTKNASKEERINDKKSAKRIFQKNETKETTKHTKTIKHPKQKRKRNDVKGNKKGA